MTTKLENLLYLSGNGGMQIKTQGLHLSYPPQELNTMFPILRSHTPLPATHLQSNGLLTTAQCPLLPLPGARAHLSSAQWYTLLEPSGSPVVRHAQPLLQAA